MLLLFFLLALVIVSVVAQTEEKTFELNITQAVINPDCSSFSTSAVLANNQLPGPAISVNQGDRVRIIVRNQLSNSTNGINDVTVHFHGIRQYGTPFSDGVPYLTQDPIPPGSEFIHEFRVVNQAGTYYYHAHVGLQEQTLFGPFIVHAPTPLPSEISYDEERIISLSEWWHLHRTDFEAYVLGPNFDLIPEAASVLINGKTQYSDDEQFCQNQQPQEIVHVDPGKTYRLRVIGATTFRTLGFAIAHHNLTIIEVDGELVKPYETPFLEVAPGQRFSVLLKANQPPRDYPIATIRRWAEGVDPRSNGRAILRYSHTTPSLLPPASWPPSFPERETPHWIWSHLEPLHGVDPIVRKPASHTILLRTTDRRMSDGTTRWFINGIAFTEPKRTILHDLMQRTRPAPIRSASGYDPYLGTFPLDYYEIVDIVLQSTHRPGEPCRSHPWHTHGHSHWEIARGPGEYDPQKEERLPTPIQKDVTLVYPQLDPALEMDPNNASRLASDTVVGCGWSKIRILAVSKLLTFYFTTPQWLISRIIYAQDNPGICMFPVMPQTK